MKKKKRPERPERPDDLSVSTSFRTVSTQHAIVSTYKGSITILLPGGDYHWFNVRDADKFFNTLRRVIEHRKKMDAWYLRYEPDSWEAREIRRKNGRRAKKPR